MFSNSKGQTNPEDDTKVYGCAVMRMELGSTGVLFQDLYDNKKTNINPKYIKFNSEIAIRKGNEGWIINSRIDNWSSNSETYFEYLLTTYEYDGNQWQKGGDPKLWTDPSLMDNTPQLLTYNSGKDTINNQNKKLVIKVPKDTWFNDSDWVSPSATVNTKTKTLTETKNWSGIWIDSETEVSNSWIFEDIELYMNEKKNSQVFCKGGENDCFQSIERGATTQKPAESDKWSQAVKNTSDYSNEKARDTSKNTVKGIIDKLTNSKGSWKKLESVCEAEGEPDEKQKELLKMYCASGKAPS